MKRFLCKWNHLVSSKWVTGRFLFLSWVREWTQIKVNNIYFFFLHFCFFVWWWKKECTSHCVVKCNHGRVETYEMKKKGNMLSAGRIYFYNTRNCVCTGHIMFLYTGLFHILRNEVKLLKYFIHWACACLKLLQHSSDKRKSLCESKNYFCYSFFIFILFILFFLRSTDL